MKIQLKVKTNAKNEYIERVTQPTLGLLEKVQLDVYKISVKEPPVDGRANRAIVKALAVYFDVAPSCVSIISGETSKLKVVDIIL